MTRIEQLYTFAIGWEEKAREEEGKTEFNGWTSREVHNAESRRIYCLEKMEACLQEIARLEERA